MLEWREIGRSLVVDHLGAEEVGEQFHGGDPRRWVIVQVEVPLVEPRGASSESWVCLNTCTLNSQASIPEEHVQIIADPCVAP